VSSAHGTAPGWNIDSSNASSQPTESGQRSTLWRCTELIAALPVTTYKSRRMMTATGHAHESSAVVRAESGLGRAGEVDIATAGRRAAYVVKR